MGISSETDDKVTECVLAASTAVLEYEDNSVAGGNNVDFFVEDMTNLIIQEMSEIEGDHVFEPCDNYSDIDSNDAVQLWIKND